MQRKNPILRMAIRLQNHIGRIAPSYYRQLEESEALLDGARLLQHHVDLYRLARTRSWPGATLRMEQSCRDDLLQLRYTADQAIAQLDTASPTARSVQIPALRELLDDLDQLHQEFPRVEFGQGTISVFTEPIKLEDVFLGEFEIRLSLNRLLHAVDSSVFNVIAQDPHPAAVNHSVTHPHVQDEKLCAGEASIPIASSLRAGQFCDAFLAVNAVLHTYNAESPYVSLAEWTGTSCEDCGSIIDRDDTYFCEGCDHEYCSECINSCGCCENSRCLNCLEEDRVSHVSCCSNCRNDCSSCGRMVDENHFDSETELCPDCLDEKTKADESNQTQEKEIPHDPSDHLAGSGNQVPGDQSRADSGVTGIELAEFQDRCTT